MVEAGPDRTRTPQVEHPDRDARALEVLLPAVEEVEETRREPCGLLGHADTARPRQLLHAGGEPDDVTLRGVVHAQIVADSPDDDLARVEAHPHREIEPALAPHVFGERPEVARQLERGRAGALGVVLVGDRGAEERHDAVAGVLVDRPLVVVDAVREDPEEAIEEAMPLLGIDTLSELHRARDVGEEDGDGLALALERALGGENLLDEVARRVGARLGGGRRHRQMRAAVVAEPRPGGVLVSAEWAAHRAYPSQPCPPRSRSPDTGERCRSRGPSRRSAPAARSSGGWWCRHPTAAPRRAALGWRACGRVSLLASARPWLRVRQRHDRPHLDVMAASYFLMAKSALSKI